MSEPVKPQPKAITEPRSCYDIRWNASALIWPNDHITAEEFRERLQFFALNAPEDELTAFANWVQL